MKYEKLKNLILENLEISLLRFSRESGVNRDTLYRIIKGNVKGTLSLLTIKKICKYFNVDFKNYLE